MSQWFSLSQGQQARWFQYRLNPAARGDHNNVFVAALDGDAIAGRLAEAIDALVARHPMLRARLRQDDEGRIEQTVTAPWPGVLETVDARGLDLDALRRRISDDAWRAFDDDRPLLRARLYRRGDGGAVLLLALDHLICDGWSYWRMLDELSAALGADGAGTPPPSETGHDYGEYVRWQEQWLHSAAGERQLDYWRGVLEPSPQLLELPAADAGASGGQQAHTLLLDPALGERLRGFVADHGGSVFSVLLAALQILLHRYSGHRAVAVGAPMPCRGRAAWRGVVGDFVNMVALRAEFDDDARVIDVVEGARRALRGGVRHQDYPISTLIRRLELGGTPFDASLVFQNARESGPLAELWNPLREGEAIARWGDTALSAFPIQQRVALDRMALAVHAIEFEQGLRCDFIHDPARVDAGAVARMAVNFETVLRAMLTEPDALVRTLPLLGEEERARVLEEFNATRVEHRGPETLHGWFQRSARAVPQAIALRHGAQTLSYAELERRSDAVAARLQRLGVQPQDRVAIHLSRGPGLVAAVLGALKAGAAYVPMDPAYPRERVVSILDDCGARVRIATAALAAEIPADLATLDIDDASLEGESALPVPRLPQDALAYVIYTSGSTGTPKGVMIEHANACNFIAWALRDGGPDAFAQTLFATSISFDLAVYEIFATLAAGGTLEIVRDVLEPPCGPVGLINTVPSGMSALLQAQAVPASVRRINVAGEPLRAELVERIFANTQAQSVHNLYGPTETTTYSTGVRIRRGEAFAAHIGRPIDNTRIYIVDRAGQPLPIGVGGEICIGGAGVARGYLGRPELTAERFGADPFVEGGRWYRTGDLGRWTADGDIVYLGRSDHQVKIRGFRIEPGEIEAALLRIEAVQSAVVVAWGDATESRRLVAYVVPVAPAGATPQALRDALTASLPAHMVPAAFVLLDRLPLTPNGKLDRAALPAPQFSSDRAYSAPDGEIERRMAEIWGELLGVARVGRDDDFFDLGGHSLLAMQLTPRLRTAFGVEVPLAKLFEAPVLRHVAAQIAAAQAAVLATQDMQAMLDELEGLSDDELMELLSKEAIDD
ncbi:non-ribosomal peptide synthetase [Marilutibacter maris]|uniref:non-ribosomal peptide synthetase n=1 Tax=Marilutibacter maris TaxID=1605891 RepID=UPI00167C91B7|nr:non-ribosomal peptide synthetase [Lysobacter maris]